MVHCRADNAGIMVAAFIGPENTNGHCIGQVGLPQLGYRDCTAFRTGKALLSVGMLKLVVAMLHAACTLCPICHFPDESALLDW